jgi:hypothetical protein
MVSGCGLNYQAQERINCYARECATKYRRKDIKIDRGHQDVDWIIWLRMGFSATLL